MLEGILKKKLGHKSRIFSCGFEPSGVDPQAIRAMAEEQIVIAGHTSDALEEFHGFEFDHIFFFPIEKKEHLLSLFPKSNLIHLAIPEISGYGGAQRLEQIRRLSVDLQEKAQELIAGYLS